MFRKSGSIDGARFTMMAFEHIDGFSKEDLKKFSEDKSGRLAKPAPGYEDIDPEKRLWAKLHEVHQATLVRTAPSVYLANVYDRYFGAALEEQPLGEWTTVRLYEFMRNEMGKSACITICGERCLEINPKFLDKFWEFDTIAFQVTFGPPKWISPRPTRIRDEWNMECQKIIKDGLDSFDWNGPAADSEWEPTFGSRYMRSLIKLCVDNDLSLQTAGGIFGGGLFG
jgi:hypothetical protein